MVRRCLLLDLADDPELIARYRDWHRPGVTPQAVLEVIRAGGVQIMEIYLSGDRLVMIVEEDEAAAHPLPRDLALAAVDWEARMDVFQRPAPGAQPGRKWTPAEKIFDLAEHERQDATPPVPAASR